MGIIRHRVATRGSLTDDFPDLGFKAYLVRERASGAPTESPVNQYAPFYLWHDASGMGRFLWGGGGFHGIVSDFGRPSVRHWTGIGCLPGPSARTTPRAATRRTTILPADADPSGIVERELDELRAHAAAPGVHSAALALDPHRWELVRFTFWEQAAAVPAVPAGQDRQDRQDRQDGLEGLEGLEGQNGIRYEVLHLSAPHLRDLLALDTNVTVTPMLRHK